MGRVWVVYGKGMPTVCEGYGWGLGFATSQLLFSRRTR